MKITRERLKEIIAEELENSQNEPDQLEEIDLGKAASVIGQMVKGRLFRVGTKYYDYYAKHILRMAKSLEEAVEKYGDNYQQIRYEITNIEEMMARYKNKERDRNLIFDFIPNRQQEEVKAALDKLDQAMAKAGEIAQDEEDKKMLQLSRERYRKEQADRERRKNDEEAMERMRQEVESEYNEKRWARDSAEREKNRSRSPINVSGRNWAYGDNPGRSGYSVREGKITKDALKGMIAEELTAVEKGKKVELEKELTGIAGSRGISKTMNKGAQDKIEKELDDLKHK
jgi:hypothetical protein|tara:strand:+ start:433 stop:1290 length:858 start_codon:yes stop_codon:yes gene_type:complete